MSLPTSDDESNSKLSQTGTNDSSTEEEIKVSSTRLEVIALDSPSSGNVSLLDAPSTGSVASSPRKTDTEQELDTDTQQTDQLTLSVSMTAGKSDNSAVSVTEEVTDIRKSNVCKDRLTESKGEFQKSETVSKVDDGLVGGSSDSALSKDCSAELENRRVSENDSAEGINTSQVKETSCDPEQNEEADVSEKSSSSCLPDTSGIRKLMEPPEKETEDPDKAAENEQLDQCPTEELEKIAAGPSKLSAEERRLILKRHQENYKPLQDVLKEYFEPDQNSGVDNSNWRQRLDTLDDVSEFSFDTQTTRLTSVDSEAEQESPSAFDTPERSRRSISAPLEPAPKINVDRRAFSEAPTFQAKSAPKALSEGMEIGSSISSFGSQQISYEESSGESENVSGVPSEHLPSRQVSEESADNVGVSMSDLPSETTSEDKMESADNEQASENGKSRSTTESSTRTSEVEQQCQNLQGWLDRGNFEDKRYITEQPEIASSSNVLGSDLMPQSSQMKSKRLSDIEEKDLSEISSLSEATESSGSEVRKLTDWLSKGDFPDDRHLTKSKEHPDNKPEEISQQSEESVEKCTIPLSPTGPRTPTETNKSELQGKSESEGNSDKKDNESAKPLEAADSKDEPCAGREESSGRKTRSKRKRIDTVKGKETPDLSDHENSDVSSPTSTEGLASKKYRSEFSKPEDASERMRRRSHSTGSVQDADKHSQKFRDWKHSLRKRTPEKESEKSQDSEDTEESQ